MRFDEFVADNGIAVVQADQFDGFAVSVILPPDWAPLDIEPYNSVPGTQAWAWPADPCIERHHFGANAVLSMSRVEASLDPAEAFAMLCEWQVHMVGDTHERHRALEPATEGPGVVGTLMMEITTSKYGPVASVSRTRIIPAGEQTLIAQLTITALLESPIDKALLAQLVCVCPAVGRTAAAAGRRTPPGEPRFHSGCRRRRHRPALPRPPHPVAGAHAVAAALRNRLSRIGGAGAEHRGSRLAEQESKDHAEGR